MTSNLIFSPKILSCQELHIWCKVSQLCPPVRCAKCWNSFPWIPSIPYFGRWIKCQLTWYGIAFLWRWVGKIRCPFLWRLGKTIYPLLRGWLVWHLMTRHARKRADCTVWWAVGPRWGCHTVIHALIGWYTSTSSLIGWSAARLLWSILPSNRTFHWRWAWRSCIRRSIPRRLRLKTENRILFLLVISI